MDNHKKVWVFGVPLIIVIVALAAFFVGGLNKDKSRFQADGQQSSDQSSQTNNDNQQGSNQQQDSQPNFAQQYSSVCDSKTKATFTHAPLALDKMGYIIPLGQMADGHVTPTDHVYVAPNNPDAADNTFDVVMPADGKVVDIGRMPAQYIGDKAGQQTASDDFRMTVAHGCQYYSIFIHLHKLSDKLAAAIGELPAGQSKQVNVDLKAGELLAHIGGTSFDWTLVDTEKKLTGFISPELYQGESWKIHTISPFDVYTGDLKSKLEAKSLRTVAPLAGKIDYDVPGKLIGNWFKENTNGYAGASQDRYYDGHLAIAPHHIDPNVTIYSTGNWSGKAAQYAIKGTFKAEDISASSGITKIELTQATSFKLPGGGTYNGRNSQKGMTLDTTGSSVGTVLLQVMENEKLKVEQFPGKTPAQVSAFTSDALMYER